MSNRAYIVKLIADGIFHHQVVEDMDDLHVLDLVLKKIKADASKSVPRYLPVPISHYHKQP